MIVNVTKEYIAAGIRCSNVACPVALAISDALYCRGIEFDHVWTDGYGYHILKDGQAHILINGELVEIGTDPETGYVAYRKLPEILKFVTAFDFGDRVEPFTFEIDESP